MIGENTRVLSLRGWRQRLGGARSRPGIALPFVLLMLTLLLVILSMVAKQGIGVLHHSKTNSISKQALFAAEAGAADALRRLVEDPNWVGPLPRTELDSGFSYAVEVLNNFSGPGPELASNGTLVPMGFTYLEATGFSPNDTISRQAFLLVTRGSASALGFAIGAGGTVRMQGSKTIFGSVKANRDIRFQGSTSVRPMNGSGRVLSSQDVRSQGSFQMDEAQDVRARGSVQATPGVRGTEFVESGDTSESTEPFIADGRTTNALNPGEVGQVLPNPDQSVLLDLTRDDLVYYGADIANDDGSDSTVSVSGVLDLEGKIHYFPGGVEFTGSSSIVGEGTIVVGHGNSMRFQGSTTAVNANLIALRHPDQMPSSGNPSIRFQGSANVSGLIYAHEDIEIQGSFRLDGVMIAYRDGGGDIDVQGSSQITLASTVLANVPGFEAWSGGFAGVGGAPVGSGPLSILSWERR